MKTNIYKTYSEFLRRENAQENGVSEGFAKDHPDYIKQNSTNEKCWNCSDCSGCSDCSELSPQKNKMKIPIIKNIHQEVLKAVSTPNALDMSTWHTCNTTHCSAGWVVTLAGKAGKELEEKTSTLFAAVQILKASSDIRVSPPRFYENNEKAMADIKKCAEMEKAQ